MEKSSRPYLLYLFNMSYLNIVSPTEKKKKSVKELITKIEMRTERLHANYVIMQGCEPATDADM